MDQTLREALLAFLIEMSTSSELSDWLRELGVDSKGTQAEKTLRIRQHTKFFTDPARSVIDRVVHELRRADAAWAEALCEKLGLPSHGPKSMLVRRVDRYIAAREGLLPVRTANGLVPTFPEIYPIVEWYPVYQRKDYEKEHYGDFAETMIDIFGEQLVHQQVAVAHGSTLKIDFHIGSPLPGAGGVGIEFKMPANNSEIQKAIGQMGQYRTAYRDSLIVVIFPHLLESKHLVPFQEELKRMNIAHVVK